MKSTYLYSIIFSFLLSSNVFASELYCPKSISVKQIINNLPQGWKVTYGNENFNLARITFFDGPPEDNASLVYDHISESGDEIQAEWHFKKSNPDRSIWITCNYESTNVVLSKLLPPSVKECKVTYYKDIFTSGSNVIKETKCK